ncbi:MAG: prepilin-type N-terminal cleavage/methylation domain-containing protein, partial [Clostridiales bacterium]|nr:prepilin-type N-terminal cleavage/methylation domain-containing protein [Clostridiales bacterium]
MNTKKAFSLVELIIVLAVIGILAAVLIPVISNVVKKANAKSALSDARNALTNYESYVQSNQVNSGDAIFIVYKAKGLYVYGSLAGKGSLYESTDNPYELAIKNANEVNIAEEAEKLLAKLIENGSVVESPLQSQENITEMVKDLPDTVAFYSGYNLRYYPVDLTIEKELIELAVGDVDKLVASVTPEAEIKFMSDNPEVASVDENGTIIAKAVGSTNIQVKSNNKTAICTVNVLDYIEFSGS